MKQIVDKLNKIAKKIDESVEIPQTDLIIDSLDAITKAYGGTPNDSNLIVDKLEDIYNNIEPAVSGNIEITENGENINVAPYATATVNVSGGGGTEVKTFKLSVYNEDAIATGVGSSYLDDEGILNQGIILLPGITETKDVLISYDREDEEYFVTVSMSQGTTFVSYSNAVNCNVFAEGGSEEDVYIEIIDINEPASVNITVSAGGIS